jgi:hypothetical protein
VLYSKSAKDLFERYVDEYENPLVKFWKREPKGGNSRGHFIEDHVMPDVLEQELGYEVICAGDDCGGQNGIDSLAWDSSSNEFVVVESKYSASRERFTKSTMDSTRDVERNGKTVKCKQMTDCWIQDSIQEEIIKDSDQENIFDDVSQEVKQEIKDEYNGRDPTKALGYEIDQNNGKGIRSEVLDTRPDRDAKTLGGDDIDQRIDRYHGLKLDAAAAPPGNLNLDSKNDISPIHDTRSIWPSWAEISNSELTGIRPLS